MGGLDAVYTFYRSNKAVLTSRIMIFLDIRFWVIISLTYKHIMLHIKNIKSIKYDTMAMQQMLIFLIIYIVNKAIFSSLSSQILLRSSSHRVLNEFPSL